MTAPFIVLVVCVVGALVLLAVVVGARRPEEGYLAWVRQSFGSFRQDVPAGGGMVDVGIEDLLSEDSDAIGYLSPEALKGRIAGARDLVRR